MKYRIWVVEKKTGKVIRENDAYKIVVYGTGNHSVWKVGKSPLQAVELPPDEFDLMIEKIDA